jgi:hypothetical protein
MGKKLNKAVRGPRTVPYGEKKVLETRLRELQQAKREFKAQEDVQKMQQAVELVDANDPRWAQLAYARIRHEPWWWFEHFVWTNDPHDKDARIKQFPMYKGYFKPILETILRDKVVVIVKSRQMLISWLLSGFNLWVARFFPYSEGYVQCYNETVVEYFVNTRMRIIEQHLPKWQRLPNAKFTTGYLDMPDNGSFIEGLPAGSEKARGRVPSVFTADEMASWEKGMDSVGAILPQIAGDSYFVIPSTPKGKNHFHKMCHPEYSRLVETLYPIPESPMTKIERYAGRTVIWLHYTADPDKRTADWKKAEKERLEMSDELWEQEYELNFDVTGNPKLYPGYEPLIHEADVKYNAFRPIIRGWDFGYERPACAMWQKNEFDQVVVLDALMGDHVSIEDFAEMVIGFCKNAYPAGTHEGRSVPIKYRDYCDIAGKQDKDTGNTIKVLRTYGIHPRYQYSHPAERTILIANRLRMRSDGKPGILVNRHCQLMVQGFRGGFSCKPDLLGKATGVPFKDKYYEHPNDAFGYSIEGELGSPRKQRDKEDEEERRRHRRIQTRQFDAVTGYSFAQ